MTNIGTGQDTTVAPPKYMLVQPNLTCNLRCQHCHLWRNTDPRRKTDEFAPLRLRAVREFAEISPRGTVITCGGEPLVEPGHYFDLCQTAREAGLTSMSVLNGTLTKTQEQADDLLARGADEISLSLDHPDEEKHDQLRGKRGSWRKTTRCLQMLLDARERLRLPRKIYVMLMVCDVNYQQIREAYELALRKLGADKLKLNFLQPTISLSTRRDAFWDLHTRNIDCEVLMGKIAECEAEYRLDFNPRWKEDVRCYVESLARYHRGGIMQTTRKLCNSAERNIVIEIEARMRLCFHSKFPSVPYREEGDLRRYWANQETEEVRRKMRECRDFCGICHTFKRNPSSREAAARILGDEA